MTARTATGAAGPALLGAGLALALSRLPPPGAARSWSRTNHRGRTVLLTSGPALAVAATAASGLPQPAASLAGLGAAAVGRYDDLAGSWPGEATAKGLRGHLAALRAGRVTGGTAKLVGIGAGGTAAVALLPGSRTPLDVGLGGAVVAGAANLVNLLDLRPGRALKAGLAGALALRLPGVAATAAVLLPDDLAERTMLGDAGANALGALLGLAVVDRLRTAPRARTVAALAVLAGLTAVSEFVSYSRVIDAVPPLRWVDRLGREV